MRLFIALNLPPEEREGIQQAIAPLRGRDFPVRWVSPDHFHLTMKFLGEVEGDRVPDLDEVLRRVGRDTSPFSLCIGGFGAFPTIRRPRVLWVGVDPSPPLRCLKQDLEWALSELGFERETRAFHPHLTLGRVKSSEGAGAFRGLDAMASELEYDATVAVDAVDLMRSRLSPSGARYEVLSRISLEGSPTQ